MSDYPDDVYAPSSLAQQSVRTELTGIGLGVFGFGVERRFTGIGLAGIGMGGSVVWENPHHADYGRTEVAA